MKKLLCISCVLIIQSINLEAYDDVYSETNSYSIHQVNSNNTYNDNSKVLSDNSFTLFGGWGNDYSNYMNNESILYLSAYVTGTFGGVTQGAAGAQIGVYEDLYILGEYGVYSAPEDFNLDDGKAAEGTFVNYGLSYHAKISKNALLTMEVIYRKMLEEKYSDGSYFSIDKEIDHNQGFLMFNFIGFKKSGHTGLELGMGFGEDLFTFKAGLKFRYF